MVCLSENRTDSVKNGESTSNERNISRYPITHLHLHVGLLLSARMLMYILSVEELSRALAMPYPGLHLGGAGAPWKLIAPP